MTGQGSNRSSSHNRDGTWASSQQYRARRRLYRARDSPYPQVRDHQREGTRQRRAFGSCFFSLERTAQVHGPATSRTSPAPPHRRAGSGPPRSLSFGLGAVVASSVKGKDTTALYQQYVGNGWQQYLGSSLGAYEPAPAAPQTPKVACGHWPAQGRAEKGDAAYIQEHAHAYLAACLSGYPPPSAPVYSCPVCITRLAQAAANNDACAAATALVFGIAMDTDSSGGPGTAGGAQANGAGAQAKSLICGMTRGDGVTGVSRNAPGARASRFYKSIRYKDTEVPCAVCGNGGQVYRLRARAGREVVVKDNTGAALRRLAPNRGGEALISSPCSC